MPCCTGYSVIVFKQPRVCLTSAADSKQKHADYFSNIVGHSNVSEIQLNGQLFQALLDTGANVSTISHSAYLEFISDIPLQPLNEFQLKIQGAGDHTLPYIGYISVDVSVPKLGTDSVGCLILVVPDTKYAESVPIILGTNILKPIMNNVE